MRKTKPSSTAHTGNARGPADESAERLRAILDTAVEGIITIDEHGLIESANRAAETIFGFPAAEMIGRNVSMLMPSPFREKHDTYIDNYLSSGKAKIIGIGREVVGLRKDGTVFPMDLAVSEVILPGRRLFTGFVRDISQRKQQELALASLTRAFEEKNRELESIVYVASHDLRSPLVNIQGFSNELKIACDRLQRLIDDAGIAQPAKKHILDHIRDEVTEPLAFIQASAVKIDRLLSGLLKLSRLGRAALKIERLDMNRLVRHVVDSLQYQIHESGGTIEVGSLPPCRGDEVQVNQVFSNLIDNAVKYREPNRTLRVVVTGGIRGDDVIYEVRDNGQGIAPAHQGKAFELFHRLHPDRGTGEGLGLTIAQRIIQRLGGRIRVESAPDQGCSFFVALPHAAD
jgi:PAS domain S-box-containing protein